MPNSGDDSFRKCFSGVISRLLCSGSLPTHPSEQLTNKNVGNQKPEKREHYVEQVVGTSPGIVAKLMGLESFPTTPRDRTLGAYFRSKSVNSVDFLSHFDPINGHQHRRAKTSVSFRYQGVNDDLILHETGGTGEVLFVRKLKEKRRRRNREYFENSPENLASEKKSENLKEKRRNIKAENSKVKMKKKKHSNNPHRILPDVARRQEIANSRRICSREDAIITRKNQRKVKNKERESCYYKRMVEVICMMSEEEAIKLEIWKQGDFEEVIQQFGHEILDVLLNHLVHELVLLFE